MVVRWIAALGGWPRGVGVACDMGRGRGRLWATAGEPLRQEEEDVRHAIASVKIHIGEAVGLGRGRGSGACGQRGGSEPEGQVAPLGGVGVGPVGMRITRVVARATRPCRTGRT